MKRGTPDHPKAVALQQRLGIRKAELVGTLELLWHFTAKYAPAGDVGRWSNEAIAMAVDWAGDPRALIDALAATGWLDPVEDEHRLVVHDWWQHAEDAVHMALARAGERFADGRVPKLSRFNTKKRKELEEAYEADAHAVRMRCAQPARAVRTALPSPALPSHVVTPPKPPSLARGGLGSAGPVDAAAAANETAPGTVDASGALNQGRVNALAGLARDYIVDRGGRVRRAELRRIRDSLRGGWTLDQVKACWDAGGFRPRVRK